MIILGIDPGLAILGWGVVESEKGRQRLINYGCILTTPQQTFPERLKQIGQDMRDLLALYKPDEIAFEELFFAKNVTTALTVGAARGVAVAACADYTDQLYEYHGFSARGRSAEAERRLCWRYSGHLPSEWRESEA